MIAALLVLPLLYVVPRTRPLWLRHRYLLLAVQAALTYGPFAILGAEWEPSGWLAGLVLLTVPVPASWFAAAIATAVEAALWSGAVVELAHEPTVPAAAALAAIAVNPARAREQTAAAAMTARQALDEVREVAARFRDAPWPEASPAEARELLAPRFARAVLAVTLCGFAVFYVLEVVENVHGVRHGYSTQVVALTIADAVALVALQLRHSSPSRGVARPRGWPATLLLQTLLTYALFLATGWHPLIMCGFLAGSALLLVPAAPGLAAFAAVIASVPAQWAVKPWTGLTILESLGGGLFLTVDSAALGLLVFGLTRLAQLAVQLENLRGELARKAVAGERLRVARDTHDLLGFGLSAIAMKADLIGKLIGRGDTRASEETAELARICATARADIRLVAGEARDLPLDAELAAARDILASAGIDVRWCVSADPPSPPPEMAGVLVPVVREAVTNILRHASARCCTLELTADARQWRLSISNDGGSGADGGGAPVAAAGRAGTAAGRAGNGLRNLAGRLEGAGGQLAVSREDGMFRLTAELPLAESESVLESRAGVDRRAGV